jgi:hypothetical protein
MLVRGSEGDETNPPALLFVGAAAALLLVPYLTGLLVALALRSPSRRL